MPDSKRTTTPLVPPEFGVPIESALARRERFADSYDYDFGQERVFPQLVAALLAEIPDDSEMLEVGAATGLMTGPLLAKATRLTALEPSPGMLRRLVSSDVASSPKLGTMQGMAEDLLPDAVFDVAVVTFTPRRGIGLLHLLKTLARHVRSRVVMLLDEDGTMDWAYLARAASLQGFDVRLHIVTGDANGPEPRRAVILIAEVGSVAEEIEPEEIWEFESRTIDVPYPAPRGAATRLVRYFLTAGERMLLVRTDEEGLDRLYGNLRTAVHRLGRDEVTVRRTDEGVQIVRLPRNLE
jgi:Methyltransferase domain